MWVSKWVDYTSKYGMGYLLCDRSVGVCFNDCTKIVLSSDGHHFEYTERRGVRRLEDGTRVPVEPVRHVHTMESYPHELNKKVLLLKH
ncbi:MAG: hypothetical protein ACK4ZJ_16140, partial [Allorhizobium sp.]